MLIRESGLGGSSKSPQAPITQGGLTIPKTYQQMVMDPNTFVWEKKTIPVVGLTTEEQKKEQLAQQAVKKKVTVASTQKASSTGNTSTDKAQKEAKEYEYTFLTGEITILPLAKNMKIKVGDMIYLEGVGSHLSGSFIVTGVKTELNASDGLGNITLTVTRTNFGDSLKAKPAPPTPTVTPTPVGTANFKVGDKVTFSNVNAIYSNASEGVKVPAWVQAKVHTISKVSTDSNRVLLKEIYSWTYTKFLKKV